MPKTVTMDTRVELALQDCCVCGVVFGVPIRLVEQRRQSGDSFYCPNGHRLSWKESEVDRFTRRWLDWSWRISTRNQFVSQC